MAWEHIDVDSLNDPAILKPYADRAVAVKLDPLGRQTVRPTAITAATK